MELKYPYLKTGLYLIFISWWLENVGGFVTKILSLIDVTAKAGEVLEFLVAGLGVTCLYLVGLWKCGKDDKRYRGVLWLYAFTYVATMICSAGIFLLPDRIRILAWCAVAILGLIFKLRICKITDEIVTAEGYKGVEGYYYIMRILYIVRTVMALCGFLGTEIPAFKSIAGILLIPGGIGAFLAEILYVLFLHHTAKFFKNLKKEELQPIE